MKKELIGYCAVDSGQILITYPCYIDIKWKMNTKYNPDNKENYNGEYSYRGCCHTSLHKGNRKQLYFINKKNGVRIFGAGVVSSTRDGDGSYPVYAVKDEEGLLVSLTIEFD